MSLLGILLLYIFHFYRFGLFLFHKFSNFNPPSQTQLTTSQQSGIDAWRHKAKALETHAEDLSAVADNLSSLLAEEDGGTLDYITLIINIRVLSTELILGICCFINFPTPPPPPIIYFYVDFGLLLFANFHCPPSHSCG